MRRCCFLGMFLLAVGGHVATAAQPSRPNIVFFFADDQRYDALSCAGHPLVKTPVNDRRTLTAVPCYPCPSASRRSARKA